MTLKKVVGGGEYMSNGWHTVSHEPCANAYFNNDWLFMPIVLALVLSKHAAAIFKCKHERYDLITEINIKTSLLSRIHFLCLCDGQRWASNCRNCVNKETISVFIDNIKTVSVALQFWWDVIGPSNIHTYCTSILSPWRLRACANCYQALFPPPQERAWGQG